MPILATLGRWLAGGVIESAGKVATDVGKTFFGDKSAKEEHVSAEQLEVLKQYAAEFVARNQRTWWDSFVDGANRMVRPSLALGAQLAFVWAAYDPVTFSETMVALQLVPEMLWVIWLSIFAFFFGGRIIENAPKTWKVEPRALEVAKSIAEERASRRKAESAQIEAIAAERVANAEAETAEKTARAETESAEAAEKKAQAARRAAVAEAVAARAAQRQADAAIREANAECPDGQTEPDVQTPDDRATGAMHISERGLELIREFEGLEERAYICPGGARTIGYGHVIKPGEPYNDPDYTIRIEDALDLLDRDCDVAENAVNQLVTVPLTQNQFDALVSLVFNIGVAAFSKSTLLRKLNAGDTAGAAQEFARWHKSKGKALPGLKRRRHAEASLFSGD